MKNYRNVVAVLVLAFVLSTSALADDGIIHTGVAAPEPAPPTSSTTQSVASDGIMHTGEPESAPAAGTLTEAALQLLQSVLPLV